MTVVTVGAAAYGAYNAYTSSKNANKQIQAQEAASQQAAYVNEMNAIATYEYNMENYMIQKGFQQQLQNYYGEQLDYAAQQQDFAYQMADFSAQQQAFAFEQKAYGEHAYQVALFNNQVLAAYRQKEVDNKKLAAAAQYKAQKDVTNIMRIGAESSLLDAVGESLRAQGANQREIQLVAQEAQGHAVNQAFGGITGGQSKERMAIQVHMDFNKAIGKQRNTTQANIIKASREKDKTINQYRLKEFEAKRIHEATQRLEPQPVPELPGPQPVFTGKQPVFTGLAPVAPVQPLGAVPIKGMTTPYTQGTYGTASNAGIAAVGGALSGMSAGMNFYNNASTIYNNYTKPSTGG